VVACHRSSAPCGEPFLGKAPTEILRIREHIETLKHLDRPGKGSISSFCTHNNPKRRPSLEPFCGPVSEAATPNLVSLLLLRAAKRLFVPKSLRERFVEFSNPIA
jgi:hypothetical protein